MIKIFNIEWVRYVAVLMIGLALGAIFYPSKTITKEETTKYQEQISRLENEKKSMNSLFESQLNMEKLQSKKYQKQTTAKIDTLKKENFKLQSRVKESRFKIIKPDGTIEEKWFKESQTDIVSSTVTSIKSEYSRKVKSIENKWKKLHEKRIKKIQSDYERKLTESKKTEIQIYKKEKIEINKRSFGVSMGMMTDQRYFSSITYDLFGPVFIDIHLEFDPSTQEKEAGLGFGFRF